MSRTIRQKTHRTKTKEIILWLTVGLSEVLFASSRREMGHLLRKHQSPSLQLWAGGKVFLPDPHLVRIPSCSSLHQRQNWGGPLRHSVQVTCEHILSVAERCEGFQVRSVSFCWALPGRMLNRASCSVAHGAKWCQLGSRTGLGCSGVNSGHMIQSVAFCLVKSTNTAAVLAWLQNDLSL